MDQSQPKKFTFTNATISRLPSHDAASPSKSAEYSDAAVPGFKAIVGKNGSKGFVFRYALASGRTRHVKIGAFPAFGVPEARAKALAMRAIVERGGDPLEDRDRQKVMPTFGEFFTGEYLPYAEKTKKSAHDDESKFRLHLNPKFGHLRLCDLTQRDS